MLKKKKSIELTDFLNGFTKVDIVKKILHGSVNVKQLYKYTKKVLINQAINILTEQFSDLEELLLFLNLKRLEIQKRNENWTAFEIIDAKKFSSYIQSHQKISQTLLKYFCKYEIPCKIYSEKMKNGIWAALFIGNDTTSPIYFFAHTQLRVVFLSSIEPDYQAITQKIIKKTFRGTAINQLNAIYKSAQYIQNLKLNSKFLQRSEKIPEVKNRTTTKRNRVCSESEENFEVRYKKGVKRSRVISSSESEHENLEDILREVKPTEPQQSPEKKKFTEPLKALKKINFPESPQTVIRTKNSSQPQEAPRNEKFPESQKAPEKIKYKEPQQAPEKIKYKEPQQAPEKTKYKEPRQAPEKPKYKEPQQAPKKKKYKEPQQAPEKTKYKEPQQAPEKTKNKEPQQAPKKTKHQESQKSPRIGKSPSFKNRNVPVTRSLTYFMKSSLLCQKKKKNADYSVSLVKFRGENVLNGLREISKAGIADGPLPNYLCKDPRSGKTQFVVTL